MSSCTRSRISCLPRRSGGASSISGSAPDPIRASGRQPSAPPLIPLLEREADEAEASLLGILWEASLGQPALASFLDQNWLEGLERSAAVHFTQVFARLQRRGLTALGLLPD